MITNQYFDSSGDYDRRASGYADIDPKVRECLRFPEGAANQPSDPRFVFQVLNGKGYLSRIHSYSPRPHRPGWIAHIRGNLPPLLSGQDLRDLLASPWFSPNDMEKLDPPYSTPIFLQRTNVFNSSTLKTLQMHARDFDPQRNRKLLLVASTRNDILQGLCQLLDYLMANYEIAETPSFSSLEGFPLTTGIKFSGMLQAAYDRLKAEERNRLRLSGVSEVLLLGGPRSVDDLLPQRDAAGTRAASYAAQTGHPAPDRSTVANGPAPRRMRDEPRVESAPTAVPAAPPAPAPVASAPPTQVTSQEILEAVACKLSEARQNPEALKVLSRYIRDALKGKTPTDIEADIRKWLDHSAIPENDRAFMIGAALGFEPGIVLDPVSHTAAEVDRHFQNWSKQARSQLLQLCLERIADQKRACGMAEKWVHAVLDPIEAAARDPAAPVDPSFDEILKLLSLVGGCSLADGAPAKRARELADRLRISHRHGVTIEVVNRAIRAAKEKVDRQGAAGAEFARQVEAAAMLAPALGEPFLIEVAAVTLAHEADVRVDEAIECLQAAARQHASWQASDGPAAAYDEIARGSFSLHVLQHFKTEPQPREHLPDDASAQPDTKGDGATPGIEGHSVPTTSEPAPQRDETAAAAPDAGTPTDPAEAAIEDRREKPRGFIQKVTGVFASIVWRGPSPEQPDRPDKAVNESEPPQPKP